jgi:hypothetical protein
MDDMKDRVLKIRDLEMKISAREGREIKILEDDDKTLTEQGTMMLLATGLHYAFKCFDLIVNIHQKPMEGGTN